MSQTQTEAEIFVLQFPFTTAAGNSVSQLTLKRLMVKDLKLIKKTHKDPADWDEPLISAVPACSRRTWIIWTLLIIWSCRNDFSKSLGWAKATKTLTQAQGLLARWFRFQPGD